MSHVIKTIYMSSNMLQILYKYFTVHKPSSEALKLQHYWYVSGKKISLDLIIIIVFQAFLPKYMIY